LGENGQAVNFAVKRRQEEEKTQKEFRNAIDAVKDKIIEIHESVKNV